MYAMCTREARPTPTLGKWLLAESIMSQLHTHDVRISDYACSTAHSSVRVHRPELRRASLLPPNPRSATTIRGASGRMVNAV
jgi:hypothetical protein